MKKLHIVMIITCIMYDQAIIAMQALLKKQGDVAAALSMRAEKMAIGIRITNTAAALYDVMKAIFNDPNLYNGTPNEEKKGHLSDLRGQTEEAINEFNAKYSNNMINQPTDDNYNEIVQETILNIAKLELEELYKKRIGSRYKETSSEALKSVVFRCTEEINILQDTYKKHIAIKNHNYKNSAENTYVTNYYQYALPAYEAEKKKWQKKLDELKLTESKEEEQKDLNQLSSLRTQFDVAKGNQAISSEQKISQLEQMRDSVYAIKRPIEWFSQNEDLKKQYNDLWVDIRNEIVSLGGKNQ